MIPILTIISLAIGQVERPPKLDFKETIDYADWVNEYQSKRLKPGENALPRYAELCKDAQGKGGFPEVEGKVKEQLDAYYTIWTESEFPDLSKFIKDNASFLEVFTKATELERFHDPIAPGQQPVEKLMPYMWSIRYAGRMMLARAWIKQPKQIEALETAHRTILRARRHMQQVGFLITDLVGMAQGSSVYSSTREALHRGIVKESDCERWLRLLQQQDSGASSWKDTICVEWASALATIQEACPEGKVNAAGLEWANKMMTGGEKPLDKKLLAVLSRASPVGNAATVDSHFELLTTLVDGPLRWAKSADIKEALETVRSKALEPSGSLAVLFVPDLSRAYQLTVRTESERRGTLLTLALHAHHAKHNKWPENLARIDPEVGLKNAKAVRVDPMTGERFIYKIKDGKPLLYSAGADGDDDGGTHHPKFGENGAGGDYVFWPRPPRNVTKK